MPDRLTRRDIYALVWSSPLAEAAKRLDLTEAQLRQICGRHRIPLPTNRYWRQRAKGANPDKVALSRVDKPWLENIEVVPGSSDWPTKRPTNGAEAARAEPVAAPIAMPALRRRPVRTRATVAWTPVGRPHELLARTVRNLYTSKPVDGMVSTTRPDLHLRLGVASLDRAIFILDALVRRLEKRGARVGIDGEWLEVSKEHHRVRVRLREKLESILYVPTPEEAKQDREIEWLRRRLLPAVAPRKFVDRPTGELSLGVQLTAGSLDRRQNWRDNKYATLEAQLDDIVLGLETWLDDLRAEEAAARRQVRLERRAQENEGRAEARKKRDRQRTGFLLEVVERAVTAEKMRAWLSAVGEPEEPETKRMIAWAHAELATLERTFHPKRFAAEIRRRELFPEVDPLAPLPDDPDE